MPYKDPERKRQWERDHREQRNANRRKQQLATRSGRHDASKSLSDTAVASRASLWEPAPDRVPDQKPKSIWRTLLGFGVGIGVMVLGAWLGASVAPSKIGTSLGSGNS